MPHSSHKMDAYREMGTSMWVAYCKNCSAETDADLSQECLGSYVRKNISTPDKKVDTTTEQS